MTPPLDTVTGTPAKDTPTLQVNQAPGTLARPRTAHLAALPTRTKYRSQLAAAPHQEMAEGRRQPMRVITRRASSMPPPSRRRSPCHASRRPMMQDTIPIHPITDKRDTNMVSEAGAGIILMVIA